MNALKTGFLLAIMTSFFILIGKFIGGSGGMWIAFVFAIIMNVGSYWMSDKIVLKVFKAKKVDESDHKSLLDIFNNLCKKANIDGPRLFVYQDDTPNAFATGRNEKNSVVAVSTSLIDTLNEDELEGVLAHELAHIENKDILIASIAATFAGAISIIASMLKWGLIFGAFRGNRGTGNVIGHLLIAILAPIIALIIQMAISRTREYKADYTAAQITNEPKHLASALRKISDFCSSEKAKTLRANHEERDAATSHMFIISPLAGGVGKLFSSHPPVEERIKRLMALKPLN
tara:strand:+ start:888 stop:1754 length:867 start_codon:yes stop_codon:yes gene_type:complete